MWHYPACKQPPAGEAKLARAEATMMIVGLLLAVLVGVSVSVLGGGGAILTVPIFVYVMGFDTKEAVASSLAVVGMTSLSGAVSHWRVGA